MDRAFDAEKTTLISIVMNRNKKKSNSFVIKVYEVINGHLKKMVQYENHVDKPDLAKDSLFPSCRIILYS